MASATTCRDRKRASPTKAELQTQLAEILSLLKPHRRDVITLQEVIDAYLPEGRKEMVTEVDLLRLPAENGNPEVNARR
jgi:hypothetical protein